MSDRKKEKERRRTRRYLGVALKRSTPWQTIFIHEGSSACRYNPPGKWPINCRFDQAKRSTSQQDKNELKTVFFASHRKVSRGMAVYIEHLPLTLKFHLFKNREFFSAKRGQIHQGNQKQTSVDKIEWRARKFFWFLSVAEQAVLLVKTVIACSSAWECRSH